MPEHRYAVIGSEQNFWLYSTINGFDLTHPRTPDSEMIYPRIPLETTAARVTIDPAKTALVVIDMQNFFLSPCLGRSEGSNGLKACHQLLRYAIPSCREAGIRIIWLNWGLTQQEIDVMPPATLRAFGFETVPEDKDSNDQDMLETILEAHGLNTGLQHSAGKLSTDAPLGKDPRLYRGIGSQIGPVELEDGSTVQAGRLLMRDTWNAALYPILENARREGVSARTERQDVWIHKNRMSGFWGAETECTKYLDSMGIKTLLFAGVNTDQCVGGSLQDAFTKGYDCILLSDGSGTTSPIHSQECVEYNVAKTWGFLLSCEGLAQGVDKMEHSR